MGFFGDLWDKFYKDVTSGKPNRATGMRGGPSIHPPTAKISTGQKKPPVSGSYPLYPGANSFYSAAPTRTRINVPEANSLTTPQTPGANSFFSASPSGTVYNTAPRPTPPPGPDPMQSLFSWLNGSDIPIQTAQAYPALNLGAPVDLSAIFGKYQGAIQGAYGNLKNVISGEATQAKADAANLRNNLAGSFADAANVYNAASASGTNTLNDMANRLGLQSTMTAQPVQDLYNQDARLKGMMASQKAGSLGTFDTLANARNATFDVANAMAAGQQAYGMSQLANQLANYQIQDELARVKAQQQYGTAALQGELQLQQMMNQNRQNQINNRLKSLTMLGTLSKLGLGGTGTSGTGGYGGTTTTTATSTNPGLEEMINSLPDVQKDIANRYFLEAKRDPQDMQKLLGEAIYGKPGTIDPATGQLDTGAIGRSQDLGGTFASNLIAGQGITPGITGMQAILNPRLLTNTTPNELLDLKAVLDAIAPFAMQPTSVRDVTKQPDTSGLDLVTLLQLLMGQQ